jgi:predicted nucleotidyltransferase
MIDILKKVINKMISPQEIQVLTDLIAIVNSLNLPIMLVGAGARLLIFDRKFGAGRATKDWDVAISIDSWQAYEQLRQALIEGNYPRFQATKNSHKFRHIQTQIEVDIVPFGKIG